MIKDNSDIGEKDNFGRNAYLSPIAVIALSFGYAVGWGAFVLPGRMFLPNAGPVGTLIGFLIGTAAIAVLAFNYHKMISNIRGSGGAYGFVAKMFGYNHGFLVGWFLFLTYVAILWANATALILLVRYLFGTVFQFGFHYTMVGFDVYFGEVMLSLAAIVFCGIVCMLGKRFAIRLHVFFVLMLILGVLLCFTAALLGHKGGMETMGPAFSPDSPQWVQVLRILAMVPWAFVGFVLYRRDFIQNSQNRFEHSTIVWIAVLIVIFFSSLMWFRLAVCDFAEYAFGELIGKTVTVEIIQRSISHVNADMLVKSIIEFGILIASLAIILNLISILHLREDSLIKEKIKAEESASKSKSYFFSTISHDIRTPLNAIIGYSQMLKMGFRKDEDREQTLDSIISGGKSLIRLIDDAIDFAKIEDGRLEFELKPTDCGKLISNLTDSFRSAKQNQSIEFRCRPAEMPILMLDRKRIRQILRNLLDNAAKFTKQGFAELRASFIRNDDDTGTLRLDVEDTGCGIGKADLERITSPYVQVDSKHARHGGTGIGLSVCYKLANAMDGELSIVSELGKGSTFTVIFHNVKVTDAVPVEDEETDANPVFAGKKTSLPEAAAAKEQNPSKTAAPKRVLIVDDQKVNLMVVLKTMLKKLGSFEVVMAENGKKAVDVLASAETPFDLVLTDMWMPEMDGEGLVRAIRADEKLAGLPVHVVTADTEMQAKYAEIGFDGILLKPVTAEKLGKIIA